MLEHYRRTAKNIEMHKYQQKTEKKENAEMQAF